MTMPPRCQPRIDEALALIGEGSPELKEALAAVDGAMARLRAVAAAGVRAEAAEAALRLRDRAVILASADPALGRAALGVLLAAEETLAGLEVASDG